jgi:hypothetical protein
MVCYFALEDHDSVRNSMSSEHDKEFIKCFEDLSSNLPSGDTGEASEWEVDLGALILRLQDDAIEKKDFARLQKQITTDAPALRYYMEFIKICTALHILLGKKQDFADIRSLLPV